ncbi:Lipoprotein-anchoring transpeptidase ErfK/SrfK [Actinopolyspora xinjiangensis]|uniref:Lipoprotein-anchoring transpeptidase ErfK/SrfK n=1 Tax=Actinopolyspora xinjiangensis TaxID=405564 RepID=A0A1H0WR99_9ACTN|nr:L,D-transpeptidase [Actinopolyspora xinjiangensis]SDP93208.1 Lipoprotein-anchoring transpeptidase ErfK/SrfK [Actinopolyspora xinjiangensis]
MEFSRVEFHRKGSGLTGARRRVVAVLGLLLVVFTTGCSQATSESGRVDEPRQPARRAKVDLSALPEATTFGTTPAAPSDPAPRSGTDGVVLRVERDIAVHDSVGGEAIARLPATQFESPTWVPIVAERGDWARVLLPSRPNGSTGWVRLGTEKVHKAHSPYVVDVDVGNRRLVVLEDGREIGSWSVGVGSADTPTPRGRTFILASIKETVSDFSPIILPLGTHSETYTTYGGGPGTVALHGWPNPEVFGAPSSDGCVRVPGDALRLLRSLPLGTLVRLR